MSLAEKSAKPCVVGAVKDARRLAHFTMDMAGNVAVPRKYARPGAALADFASGAVFERPLQTIGTELKKIGIARHRGGRRVAAPVDMSGTAWQSNSCLLPTWATQRA